MAALEAHQRDGPGRPGDREAVGPAPCGPARPPAGRGLPAVLPAGAPQRAGQRRHRPARRGIPGPERRRLAPGPGAGGAGPPAAPRPNRPVGWGALRVAIARALVGDPQVVLADAHRQPTRPPPTSSSCCSSSTARHHPGGGHPRPPGRRRDGPPDPAARRAGRGRPHPDRKVDTHEQHPALDPTVAAAPGDLLPVGTVGPARPAAAPVCRRSASIGIAAIVAVLGITRSSQAELLAQIDRLGTDLLTVTNGRSIQGQEAQLPTRAAGMLARSTGSARSPRPRSLPASASTAPTRSLAQTGAAVRAWPRCRTLDGRLRHGGFLNSPPPATRPRARLPGRRDPGDQRARTSPPVWLGATGSPWSASSTLCRWRRRSTAPRWSASWQRLLGYQGHPSRIYVRTATQQTTQVAGRWPPPPTPSTPSRSRPAAPPTR